MITEETELFDHSENTLHLRRGKWTLEEENYANKIISLFNQGKLAILPGTTLRSLLSEKLQCDPMRITKKYAGKSCIGKQIYQPCEGFQDDLESIQEAEKELEVFEKIFLQKIQAKASASSAKSTNQTNPSHPMHNPHSILRSPSQRIMEKQSEPIRRMGGGGFSRRNLSAPNLTRLGQGSGLGLGLGLEKGGALSSPLQSIKEEGSEERMKFTEEFFLLGGRVPNPHPNPSTSSFTAKKRSHSVMALMDFERLVADDRAAGDLFYEFVTMIGSGGSNKKQQTSSSSSRKRSASGGEVTVLLDSSSYSSQRGEKMRITSEEEEGEEEGSSYYSRETVVPRYHPHDPHERGTGAREGEMVVVVQEAQISHHQTSPLTEEGNDHSSEDCDNFF